MLAFAWRLLVYTGLIVAAASLWYGAGIVLAALAAMLWFGLPLARCAATVCGRGPEFRSGRVRFLVASSLVGLGTAALLVLVPWPGAIRAPAIVQYDPLTVVRSPSPGFVREVRVSGGGAGSAGLTNRARPVPVARQADPTGAGALPAPALLFAALPPHPLLWIDSD